MYTNPPEFEFQGTINYSSSESEKNFRRCLFTFCIKHEIKHFHVMVVQKRQSNVQKSVCTRKVVFLLIKPIVF